MVFWSRISYSRIESLTNRCKRHYSSYLAIPHHGGVPITAGPSGKVRVFERAFLSDQYPLYSPVRFFAAPVQASKPKPEQKDDKGIRLNDKIRSEYIRLVTDDGHTVVSRREALDRAKNLKLDLVEVDRCAKPPVCKIMDYHREKYKKQLTEKERMKSKANGVLRNSAPKLVKFNKKTDQKDLQTKAEQIKKMMEKGYRVKCTATGTEDEDLGALLARLSLLIEDVAVVESGPMVEKTQAFSVVRHIKYGGLKKGPKKASTSQPSTPSPEPVEAHVEVQEESDDSQSYSESEDEFEPEVGKKPKATWSAQSMNEEFEEIFDLEENKPKPKPVLENRYAAKTDVKRTDTNGPIENRYAQVNRGPSATPQGPTPAVQNRYAGVGSRGTNNVSRGGPENRYGGGTNNVSRGGPENRYGGGTNNVSRGGPENRYGGGTNTVSRGGPENRYGGGTNIVSQGGPENRYGGGTSNVSRGGPENRYGGGGEVRSRFQPPNTPYQGGRVQHEASGPRNGNPAGPTQKVTDTQRPGYGGFSAPK